jgi:ABC-2 type transport system permease protein
MIAAIRAELIKFRSVRSSIVLLCFIVAAALLVAVLVGSLGPTTNLDNGPLSAVGFLLGGLQISSLLIAVLAVLMVTQEYRFSTIRATFAANPHRLQVYLAKILTTTLLTGGAALALMAASLGIGGGIYQARGGSIPWGTATLWRLVGGHVLIMVAFGLACLGIGAIVRSSAGAIVVAMVWPIVVEPVAFGLLSVFKRESWTKYIPYQAGQQVTSIAGRGEDTVARFAPWTGFAYFCVWAIALVALGGWLLQRRDA